MVNSSFLPSSSFGTRECENIHGASEVYNFTIAKELESTQNKAFKKIGQIIEIPWASFIELTTKEICIGNYMIRTKNYCAVGSDDWFLEVETTNKFLMIEFIDTYFEPLKQMGVPPRIIWNNELITNIAMLNVYKVFWRNEDGSGKDSIHSPV